MKQPQEGIHGTLDAVVECHLWLADLSFLECRIGDRLRHRCADAPPSHADSADFVAHCVSRFYSTKENAAAATGACAIEARSRRGAAHIRRAPNEAVSR